MKIQLGSTGFDVTRFQLALRNVYRFTPVTGVFDESTLGILRRYTHDRGLDNVDFVDGALMERISGELPGSASGTFSISGSVDQLVLRELLRLGYSVSGDSGIHVAFHDSNKAGSNVVKFSAGFHPSSTLELKTLNSCLVVIVSSEIDAFLLSSAGITAPIRIVHPVAPPMKFVGIPEGSPTIGYYGNSPATAARVFTEAFSDHADNFSLVVSSKFICDDCRVVGIPALSAREWLAPLAGVITDGHSEIELCAASMGKPIIVPTLSSPHHGFDHTNSIMVSNSSFSGDHVIGLPHSRSGLIRAMRECFDAAENPDSRAHQIGLAAASRAKSLTAASAARELSKVLDEITKSRVA